jgi:hypothetical protein
MKKTISILIIISLLFGGQALAADEITVSVEDIQTVSEQLKEYDAVSDMLAQLVYAEARGVKSKEQQAAVMWCVLNRYDAGYEPSIADVITAPNQFAYNRHTPIESEFKTLAEDVLTRWLLEQNGVKNVGRVLPSDYLYFAGRNGINWFRSTYSTKRYWDWSYPDPYTEDE